MFFKKEKYSWFLNFSLIIIDISLIILIIIFFSVFSDNLPITKNVFPKLPKDNRFIIFSIILWLIISYFSKIYSFIRNVKTYQIISSFIKQSFFYLLFLLSYFGFLKIEMSRKMIFVFVIIIVLVTVFIKIIMFYFHKFYMNKTNTNFTKIIIVGESESTERLITFFNSNNENNFKILKAFDSENKEGDIIKKSIKFIEENQIDEIYCSLESLSDSQINKFIEITDKNNVAIKFIPNKASLLADKVSTDYYGVQPIFSLKKASLNKPLNQFIKRLFDIIFSLLVIIFILSWLTPLLFIMIKLESKGSLFYKHKRYGLNYKEFNCYKFRSLKKDNVNVLDQIKKNDKRLTKIGAFIRKTNIDELPQFLNILFGDMSVVGPRPHMIPYSNKYAKYFDKFKYMYRHSVKPGITGLAQIKGYRGETKKDEDIINRIKYDVFYIENWNIFQDLTIIFQTIFNTIKGEEKAY